MIEMHLDGDSLGDDDDGDDDYPPSRPAELWRLAVSAPALGLAALVIALASLTIVQAGQEFGEGVLFSSSGRSPSALTELRVSAAVRLGVAAVALILAVASGLRLRTTDLDDEPPDPLWVRVVTGAALVVAVLSIVVTGAELIYVFRLHPGAGFNG
jgi:hypothetical protein